MQANTPIASTTFGRAIKHWITYTRADSKFHEVEAILVISQLSTDHTNGRAEVPALGIVIENDARALILASEQTSLSMAEIHGSGNLRRGIMTQATFSETRHKLEAANGDMVFSHAEYVEIDRKRQMLGGKPLDLPILHTVESMRRAA